MGDFCVRS